MTSQDDQRLFDEILVAASELDEPERSAWLDEHCPTGLRDRVDAFFRADSVETEALEAGAGRAAADAAAKADEPATVELRAFEQIDEFRVLRKLGEGGMATVYLAEDTRLKRRIALKVLATSQSISEIRVARFRQEAVTVAQLQHKGIVPIHRVGQSDAIHYLAIEFVDGPTLAERLSAELRETDAEHRIRSAAWIREQVELIADVAEALEHAHRNDVIHRDVKPSNIMIDAGNTPRLTDFGIARNLRLESMTATGQFAGTVEYMSPEQAIASSRTIDHRTDVFSLGVTLYEALTLKRPFTGESREAIRQRVILRPPPPIQSLNPAISRDLQTICNKAMEKDPDDRYQSAAAFAADLRCFLEDRPILARPPSLRRRAKMWVRDHRTLSVATAVAAVLVGLALPAWSWLSREQERSGWSAVTLASDNEIPIRIIRQQLDPLSCQPQDDLPGVRVKPGTTRTPRGLYRYTAWFDGDRASEAIVYVPRIDEGDHAGAFDVTINPLPSQFQDSAQADRMVKLPGGLAPDRSHTVAPYWLDRYEVSNDEYRQFMDATGAKRPTFWRETGEPYAPALGSHPVIGVTRAEAAAYAHWIGLRLPTGAELELAMAGEFTDGRVRDDLASAFPPATAAELRAVPRSPDRAWLDGMLALYGRSTNPTDSRREHATNDGIFHILTNVREYCASMTLDGTTADHTRSGSWRVDPRSLTPQSATTHPLDSSASDRGFRCARSVSISMEP